jgi:SAM-dependent methyltransferase
MEMYGYEYAQCSSCEHVYLTQRLTEEAMVEYFEASSDYAETYTEEERLEYRLENITKPKVDFVLDQIDLEGSTTGQWLDVGCATGGSVQHLQSKGWDAVGLEVSEDSVAKAKDRFGLDLEQQTIEEYAASNPDASFDVISFFGSPHVIPTPMSLFETAEELLSDDGFMIVGVPNYESLSTKVHETFQNEALRHLRPPECLHLFTENSLENAFDQVGFEPFAGWYFGLDFYELLTHLSMNYENFQESPVYEFLMQNLDEFQKVVDKKKKNDHMVVIARRQ